MVIGNGDIATALKEAMRPADEGYIFFASGVSNSKEIREWEYQREKNLLVEQDKTKHIVYFSTLAIFYSSTRYTKHKQYMEYLIKDNFRHWTIMRLGNITWGSNPHTLINYLRMHPKAKIRNEYRYICDKEEFLHWISLIPDWNCEMNVPGRRMLVREVVKEYCG